MLKTIIVLPDGTEIFSGSGTTNAIQSVTLTECVNSGEELTLGSVCANMVEATLITPGGGLNLTAGDEIAVYKVDDAGIRNKIGLFTLEKPTRPSANKMNITAYDRIAKLDKDLTEWLTSLNGWPYAVIDFAHMVAEQCGLTLKNEELLNGSYMIRQFSGEGITGRKIMEWIGQICAKFCRATPDGEIEFAWYTNNFNIVAPGAYTIAGTGAVVTYEDGALTIESATVSADDDGEGNVTVEGLTVVSDDGNGNLVLAVAGDSVVESLYYFQSGLSFEDYEVAPVEKVQIRLTEDDVGAVYPQVTGEVNTYIITGNYLLTTDDPDALQSLVEVVYNAVSGITYTPCKVAVPATPAISVGDIVKVTDKNGKVITAYIMTKIQKGQRDTLECTGSPRRDSSSVVNSESFKALSGKVLEVRRSIDGLNIKATALDSKIDRTGEQAAQKIAEVDIKADGVLAEVTKTAHDVSGLKTEITTIQQSAQNVSIQVQGIIDNGASKVKTDMGYTFDDEGMHIQKSGEEIENLLDHTGMYVKRSGEVMLQANNLGVVATDVTVNNYLIIGEHARFEDYSDVTDTKRTACFWI